DPAELQRVKRGAGPGRPRRRLRWWFSSGPNAAQLLGHRDLVAIDVADLLATALGSLLAQPIGLLLALAQRVRALPERDHGEPAARPVGETDHTDVSLPLANLRQRLGLHLADAFVDAVDPTFQRADATRLRPFGIAVGDHDLVDLDSRPATPRL